MNVDAWVVEDAFGTQAVELSVRGSDELGYQICLDLDGQGGVRLEPKQARELARDLNAAAKAAVAR